jgi:hypothetical protein
VALLSPYLFLDCIVMAGQKQQVPGDKLAFVASKALLSSASGFDYSLR